MMGQMKLNARITPATLHLVRPYEALRLNAELQADGRWMIGYGHTRFARAGAAITPDDADDLLRYDLSESADALEALVTVPLTTNQFEALNAFALHIGLDNFRRSTVLRSLNAGAFGQAAAAMDLWKGAGASPRNPATDLLAQRRAAEQRHFLGGSMNLDGSVPSDPQLSEADPPVPEPAPTAVSLSAPVELPTPAVVAQPTRWTPPPRPSRALREAAPRRVEQPPPPTLELPPERPAHPADPSPLSVITEPSVQVEDGILAARESFDGSDPDPSEPVAPVSDPASSDAPFPEDPALSAVTAAWVSPRDASVLGEELATGRSGITVDVPPPRPLGPLAGPTTRLTYALVGLLGVMLFTGALVSMFRQANVANLVTGLVGVAFMAPAAGHFLFTALSGRPSRSALPWA